MNVSFFIFLFSLDKKLQVQKENLERLLQENENRDYVEKIANLDDKHPKEAFNGLILRARNKNLNRIINELQDVIDAINLEIRGLDTNINQKKK